MIILCLSLLSFCDLPNENAPPEISHVKWSFKEKMILSLQYDLADAEDDSIGVEISFFDAANQPVAMPADRIRGDYGFPVRSGRKKRLTVDLDGHRAVATIRITVFDLKTSIASVLAQVDSSRIRSTIQELSIPRHFKTDARNLSMIQHKLSAYFGRDNLQVRMNRFQYGSHEACNLYAVKHGTTTSKPLYIGAHVDAVPNSPGADDNASGIAAMLEISRVLTYHQLKRDVGFIAFDLEEEGLIGSKRFLADTARLVEGYFNFDMIGYASDNPDTQPVPAGLDALFPDAFNQLKSNEFRANFLLVVSNQKSEKWLEVFGAASARYVPDLKVITLLVPDDGKFAPRLFRGSDHASFWDSSIDALSIGDTGDVRNKNYHSRKDTCETINVRFLSQVTKAALAAILESCGLIHGSSYNIKIAH